MTPQSLDERLSLTLEAMRKCGPGSPIDIGHIIAVQNAKADLERLRVDSKNILDDFEAMLLVSKLYRKGFSSKKIRDAVTVVELCEKTEPERVWALSGVQKPLASNAIGTRWVHAYGAVWCIRSSAECDYCGSVESWRMPDGAVAQPVVSQ